VVGVQRESRDPPGNEVGRAFRLADDAKRGADQSTTAGRGVGRGGGATSAEE
jgi:hypothetical protein